VLGPASPSGRLVGRFPRRIGSDGRGGADAHGIDKGFRVIVAAAVRRTLNAILAVAVGLAGARAAGAAEVTRVVSAGGDSGKRFDLDLSLDWLHEAYSAAIKRESEGQATGGQVALQNELLYHQTRDALRLRAQMGVWRDLSVFAALPLVLADDRGLDFDRGGCGGVATAGCIDENNATILRDRILPGYGTSTFGLDSPHARAFQHPSQTVFAGPTRKGLEYLGLGARWALLNQDRDFAQPTWIVQLEARFAVGGDMRFDPAHPDANTAVGPGYNQFLLSTIFSRRLWALEPYLGAWYLLPAATSGSPVDRDVLGQAVADSPQHRAGGDLGVEAVVWDDPRSQRRITLELGGHFELRFLGLAQGPLWEPLSGASTCPAQPATCRPDVDRDINGDGTIDRNPGTTHVPAYGILGGDLGMGVRAGRYLRFRGLFGMSFEEAHDLSDGRSGNDVYDLPGRRFRVEDGRTWHLSIEGAVVY
jgi:hypothetical protein